MDTKAEGTKNFVQIKMNRGHYEILQASNQKLSYKIVEPSDSKGVEVKIDDRSLNIHADDTVDRLQIQIFVPTDHSLNISLVNGNLLLSELQNSISTMIVNGNLVLKPYVKPKEQYTIDLRVLSGTILYQLTDEIAATVDVKVQTGHIKTPSFCHVTSSSKIGWAGALQKLICGKNSQHSYQTKLEVEQGAITIGRNN